MLRQHLRQQIRIGAGLGSLYVLTAVFAVLTIRPAHYFNHPQTVALIIAQQTPRVPAKPAAIAGRPVRIVIPASGVDLPVDPGYYDSASGEWTLSGYRAQFAMLSTLANNQAGDTFIYGHNNNYVFGALRHNTPQPGAEALLYTDNGHIFSYSFSSSRSLTPDDTAALQYKGAPILTIQTCTGSLNEWRTLFTFNFDRVVQ